MTTQTILVKKVPSGEYLTAGDVYIVERAVKARHDAHFRNQRTGGGTFMREYAVREAVEAGMFEVLA